VNCQSRLALANVDAFHNLGAGGVGDGLGLAAKRSSRDLVGGTAPLVAFTVTTHCRQQQSKEDTLSEPGHNKELPPGLEQVFMTSFSAEQRPATIMSSCGCHPTAATAPASQESDRWERNWSLRHVLTTLAVNFVGLAASRADLQSAAVFEPSGDTGPASRTPIAGSLLCVVICGTIPSRCAHCNTMGAMGNSISQRIAAQPAVGKQQQKSASDLMAVFAQVSFCYLQHRCADVAVADLSSLLTTYSRLYVLHCSKQHFGTLHM